MEISEATKHYNLVLKHCKWGLVYCLIGIVALICTYTYRNYYLSVVIPSAIVYFIAMIAAFRITWKLVKILK